MFLSHRDSAFLHSTPCRFLSFFISCLSAYLFLIIQHTGEWCLITQYGGERCEFTILLVPSILFILLHYAAASFFCIYFSRMVQLVRADMSSLILLRVSSSTRSPLASNLSAAFGIITSGLLRAYILR